MLLDATTSILFAAATAACMLYQELVVVLVLDWFLASTVASFISMDHVTIPAKNMASIMEQT